MASKPPEEDFPPDEPIELPVTDVLDLHPFLPQEINSVVHEYLNVACEAGFRHVRIIHGRGIGVQRKAVRMLLERDSRVDSFGDAPPEAGGWGATRVDLAVPSRQAAKADDDG